jgi:hypothetical protein
VRFFVNTVTSHTASSTFRPTNHRYSRLYSSCSISIRSLRIVYNTCSSRARRSFSGGMEGRPICEYMRANAFDNWTSTASVIARIGRNG